MSTAKNTPAKKRGLGRGLEALLGPKAAAQAPKLEATPQDALRTLPIDALAPGKYQPRRTMDPAKLAELAESIRAQGVIQPIVVREIVQPRGGKTWEIIAGERRWRASRQAGLAEIPVVVREVDDRTVVAMALIENIQREDLNPLEEAQALQRLIDEFDLTHAAAAEAVGRSRAAVSARIASRSFVTVLAGSPKAWRVASCAVTSLVVSHCPSAPSSMYCLARRNSTSLTGSSRIRFSSARTTASELSVTSLRTAALATKGPGSGRQTNCEKAPYE